MIIRLASGAGNLASTNHAAALDVHSTSSDSCFEAQVDALLSAEASADRAVTTVMVDA